jgi:hypothetical protein
MHTAFALAALLAASAAAQNCSSLTMTGSGAPNSAIVLTLQGDPFSPAALAFSEAMGTTVLPFGAFGSLLLGIAPPYFTVPLSNTNAIGEVVVTLPIPASIQSWDLFAQGLTTTLSFSPGGLQLSFCTSNIVPLHVGP